MDNHVDFHRCKRVLTQPQCICPCVCDTSCAVGADAQWRVCDNDKVRQTDWEAVERVHGSTWIYSRVKP